MTYTDGSEINTGDVFTDGAEGIADIRTQNKALVLYVDDHTLVWFPLNDFTTHCANSTYRSNAWSLSSAPKKVELSELSQDELVNYHKHLSC